ncbi:MAG: alpha-L-arabinofuranosidase C-terminal domain-containing protein [Bryobacteraceae bacterium]
MQLGFFLSVTALGSMAALCPAAQNGRSATSESERVQIQVNAGKRANFKIPRTIFGSFLEPIGNSTYNGLWAEILQNPSFEENLWSAPAVARMIQDEPSLARASALGLPLPWEPLNPNLGNRYEPRWGDAANSWRSLAIFGVPGAETGIKQEVFLPIHRQLHYTGSIYVKHVSGPDGVDISIRLRNHAQEVLSHTKLNAPYLNWRKYSFTLDLPPGRLKSLEPADFVIEVEGEERALIDQVGLMPADAIDGLDPEMIEMAKAMKTPLVRFGGNFTSAYHWRDGIGRRDKRISMLNIAWGIPEYNQFGTDEFLHFCELIGAQPQIALNLGSGTPQEAADWVRYVDQHWNKHSGLLWELGNELWGSWNLGYPTLKQVAERTLEFSKAIRAVDPRARLIATGQDPDHYQEWNAAQLKNPPDTFDFLSTHFVVTTDHTESKDKSPDSVAEDSFAMPVELGRRLRAMQAQIDETEFRNKTHIAFTEWLLVCCDHGTVDAPRYDNMGGAITVAGFFNMLIQNADIAPISDMTGIIEFAGIWKKRGRVYGTPAYYTFRLYSTADTYAPVAVESNSKHYDVHHGISRLPEIADVPYLDVIATINENKDRLTIFCVNRHLNQDIPAAISLHGFDTRPTGTVQLLNASSIYEGNDEVRPDSISPVESTVRVVNSELHYTFRHESVTRIELTSR